MNGIIIPKKKLNDRQLNKLKLVVSWAKTKVEGYLQVAIAANVGISSVQKAIKGQELSEQIINKIIKAL